MSVLNEFIVEDAALEWFGELGYAVGHGPHLAPGEPAAERESFSEVVLVGRLREAIRLLNPAIPEEAREEALRKVLRERGQVFQVAGFEKFDPRVNGVGCFRWQDCPPSTGPGEQDARRLPASFRLRSSQGCRLTRSWHPAKHGAGV